MQSRKLSESIASAIQSFFICLPRRLRPRSPPVSRTRSTPGWRARLTTVPTHRTPGARPTVSRIRSVGWPSLSSPDGGVHRRFETKVHARAAIRKIAGSSRLVHWERIVTPDGVVRRRHRPPRSTTRGGDGGCGAKELSNDSFSAATSTSGHSPLGEAVKRVWSCHKVSVTVSFILCYIL